MLSLSLGNLTAWEFVLRGLLLVAGIHLYVYFVDHYSLRRYPGPFFAKFSYGWIFFTGLTFRRSEIVYQMHKQYGPVVRISPTELSFADPDAFGDLYSRTANAPKSSFYDAFATIGLPSIFATRTADHKPRRRMMYHLFTPAVVDEFAPVAARGMQTMLDVWETRHAGPAGKRTWFNCLPWCGYLAFDSLSMFLFGHSLEMLNSENDVVSIAKDTRLNFDTQALKEDHDTIDVHLTEIIGSRETYNYFVGILPAWWKPLGKAILKGPVRSAQLAAKFTSGLVTRRLARPASVEDNDLIGRMLLRQQANSEVERAPLVAELLTLIVAGSDTTRNSLVSAIHSISRNPSIQTTLQAELDKALPDARSVTLDQVKRLPYLEACISETLRVYSAVPGGLPRVAPPGGIVIAGKPVVGGTTVGVHIYSIHRDVSVWGEDAEIFRPERWLDRTPEEMKRMTTAFKPFSDGPAACIGKNLAWVQLRVMLASIFRRFTVTPKNPENDLDIDDWFVRRIRGSEIAIQSRS